MLALLRLLVLLMLIGATPVVARGSPVRLRRGAAVLARRSSVRLRRAAVVLVLLLLVVLLVHDVATKMFLSSLVRTCVAGLPVLPACLFLLFSLLPSSPFFPPFFSGCVCV